MTGIMSTKIATPWTTAVTARAEVPGFVGGAVAPADVITAGTISSVAWAALMEFVVSQRLIRLHVALAP